MLAVSPFLSFQHVTLDIGNDGVRARDIMANARNSHMRVHCKFGLEVGGWVSDDNQAETTERTLNTRSILSRSNFQAVIVSLSFFALRSRETAFRSLCLITFLWISATVL